MRVPVDKVASAVKMGAAAKREQDVPVRVAVFVDVTGDALSHRYRAPRVGSLDHVRIGAG